MPTTTLRKLDAHTIDALSAALEHEVGFTIGTAVAVFDGTPRMAYDKVARGLEHLSSAHGPKSAPVRLTQVVRRRLLDAVLALEAGETPDSRYVVVTP